MSGDDPDTPTRGEGTGDETRDPAAYSLPEDIRRALAALDAGSDSPLLDDTALAYPSQLDALESMEPVLPEMEAQAEPPASDSAAEVPSAPAPPTEGEGDSDVPAPEDLPTSEDPDVHETLREDAQVDEAEDNAALDIGEGLSQSAHDDAAEGELETQAARPQAEVDDDASVEDLDPPTVEDLKPDNNILEPEADEGPSQDDVALPTVEDAEPETIIPEPEAAEALSQEDLDALIAESTAPQDAPPQPEAGGALSQDDLDALVAAHTTPQPSAGEALSQGDLDALIRASAPSPAPPGPDAIQDLAEAPAAESAESDAPPAPPTPTPEEELDALLHTLAADGDVDAPAPADEVLTEADLDMLLAQVDGAAESSEAPAAEVALDRRGEEDVLTAGGLDSLLVGHDPGEEISVSDEHVEALLAELERPAQAPAADEEPLSQDLLDAILASAAAAPEEATEVGLENLAAAASTAPRDPAPLSPDDQAALAPDDEPPVVVADPELPEPAPVRAQSPLLAFIKAHPFRVTASLAAGLLAMTWTYVTLDTMRVDTPTLTRLLSMRGAPLEVIVEQARRMVREGEYARAVALLDPALAAARPSPVRTDGDYLRAEALYRGFADSAYSPAYDQLHARIDEAVRNAPEHPRAAEALLWKVRLYEFADLPHAAAEIYADIIAHHGDAADMDAILHDAAELSLALGDPRTAAAYTQRLLQQFPGSPHADDGRLLLADAYAAAGMLDDARTLYVRVAQRLAGTPRGATAHHRLGKLAYDQKEYARAIRDLQTYLDTSTSVAGNDEVFLLLGQAQLAAGQYDAAKSTFEELIAFFPSGEAAAGAYVALSQTLESMGDRDAALNIAMQASARYPAHPEVLRNAGEFLGLTGNAFGAANALLAAEDAGMGNPELLLAAGRYFRVAGLPAEARHTFERLRDTYPRTAQALQGNVEAAELAYANGEVGYALAQLEDIVATTKGRPERLQAVQALLRVSEALSLRERVVELAEEVAALSNEPETIALAALALLRADALTQGQEVFNRVDLARVRNQTAHNLLMALGEALLQVDPNRGLDRMEEAYLAYPAARTPAGDLKLLNVYLAAGRGAAARRVVMELADHVRRAPVDTPLLIDGATAWGDWLFARQDYRAAAEAFGMAVEAAEGLGRPVAGERSDPRWAKFQQANALFAMSNYADSLTLYQQIAATDAPWATEARIKADHAALEQRLRGASPGATS